MLAWVLCGCTDANLYTSNTEPNLPNKIGVEADICTDDPSNVAFPVKVLVVMDGSVPLVQADTMLSRSRAVQTLVERYQPNSNYSFGIIQYAGTAKSPTNGFATDTTTVSTGINQLAQGLSDGYRSYVGALRAITAAVQDDLLAAPPGRRSRTRYKIIFLAYGPPAPDLKSWLCQGLNLKVSSTECQTQLLAAFCPNEPPPVADCEADSYVQQVTDLRNFALSNGAQDLEFHAISLLPDPRGDMLMNEMATAGHGSFISQPATAVNLLAIDLTVSSTVLNLREIVVFDPNVAIENGKVVPDSDADGLSDDLELQIGTDPTMADTDGDHVGDGIEYRLRAPGLSFDPLVPAVFQACALINPPDIDTDLDGLNDCEEALLRTDHTLVDTDRDGIPDVVEVRRGGNPLVDDTLFDTAKDGITDGEKMRRGLDVGQDASSYELDIGYRYTFEDEGIKTVLGINPTDPVPGVHITNVATSNNEIGEVQYVPGPPQTLAWSDNAMGSVLYGPAVDISKRGSYTLVAQSGQQLYVDVEPSLLPLPVLGTKNETVVISPGARNCFKFSTHNVTLVQTLQILGGRMGVGWQTLQVYFAELPASTPMGAPVFNQAFVDVRFQLPNKKTPNIPTIELTQDLFTLLRGDL